ncbi:MAG: hypothetical protein AAF725_24470, partial [Acidobacteriota bacterium]
MATTRVFPSPTLVIGLGRLGLGLLERLGEDWQGLSFSGGDESLDNLRLFWVHASRDHEIEPWTERERSTIQIARHVENSDLPSLALNFAILRCLGLIRFRGGQFEVAMLRDAGLVDRERGRAGADRDEDSASDEFRDEFKESTLVRCRHFEWLPLTPDPVTSAESLKRRTEADPELDLFVNPLIKRIRQGHSPGALMACIARCSTLVQGRDPSPWPWVAEALAAPSGEAPGGEGLVPGARVAGQLAAEDGLLEYAPEPLEGWQEWLNRSHRGWLERPGRRASSEESGASTGPGELLSRAVWSQDFLDWLRSGGGAPAEAQASLGRRSAARAQPVEKVLAPHRPAEQLAGPGRGAALLA